MTLILKSHDFTHQGEIPKSFTCDGDESSQTLSWTGLPQNTKNLVMIVDDPDVQDPAKPKMTWVHWLLYNIPPTVTELPKAIAASDLPSGTLQGNGRAMAALARLLAAGTFIKSTLWILSYRICICPTRPNLKRRWQDILSIRHNWWELITVSNR